MSDNRVLQISFNQAEQYKKLYMEQLRNANTDQQIIARNSAVIKEVNNENKQTLHKKFQEY